MKRLNKALSVLLTLVMLFTTLCFFVPETEIEANAAAASYKWRVTVYMTKGSKHTDSGNVTLYWKTNNGTGSEGSAQIYSGSGDGAIWTSDDQTTTFVSDSSLSGTVVSGKVPANAYPYKATATIDLGSAFSSKIQWQVKVEVLDQSGNVLTDSDYGAREDHTVGWADGDAYTATDEIGTGYYPYVTSVGLTTSNVIFSDASANKAINETLTPVDQYGVDWVNNPASVTATNGVAVSASTKTPTITYPNAFNDYTSTLTTKWTTGNSGHTTASIDNVITVRVPRTMNFDNAFSMREWRRQGINPNANATVSDVTDNGFTVTGIGDGATDGNTGFSYRFYLKPNTTYYFTADTDYTPGTGATRGFDVYIQMMDINGANLTLDPSVVVSGCKKEGVPYLSTSGNKADVKNVCLVFTTPADMGYARIRFDPNENGSVLKVSNICISPYNDVTYSAAQEKFAAYDKKFSDYNELIPVPSRTGYRFQGYNRVTAVGTSTFDDVCYDGASHWIFAGDANYSVALSAEQGFGYTLPFVSQWLENQYWIGFDPNGGAGSMDSVNGVYYTAETKLPAGAFTRDGYTFSGWNTAADGSGTAIADGATVSRLESVHGKWVTLYAQWTPNNYTINFNANGGNGTMNGVTATYDKDTALPGNTFTREGYSFKEWNTKADGMGTSYGNNATVKNLLTSGALTLYAQWKVNQYTITFDSNGGSDVAPITQNYGTAITAPEAPTREGYTFGGWDTEIPATMPAGDMTITAKWDINEYTITFNTDGGSAVASITQEYGTVITPPAAPTKEGYTFGGWTPVVPGTMPAGDMTITAIWNVNEYTITFDTDGGSAVAPITQNYGTAITAPSDPTKEGYTFGGWTPAVPATMPAGDMTITAIWNVNQYTITFDTDGGSAIAPITQDFGTAVTAPDAPEKTGYDFIGWTPAVPATMPAENITLKANWEIKKFNVTFKFFDKDGTETTVERTDVEYGTDVSTLLPTSAEGFIGTYFNGAVAEPANNTHHYNFSGWGNTSDVITEEIVFTASYTEAVHEYFDDPAAYPATCTDKGLKAEYCECGYRYEEEIPARGHDWEETGRTVYCNKIGTINYRCKRTNCTIPGGATKNEQLQPTGHVFSEVKPKLEPTCTEIGYEAYKTCTECNLYFTVDADTMADGAEKKTEISAKGHSYGTWIAEVPAECETNGTKGHYTCSACGKFFDKDLVEITDLTIEKTGHSYVATVTPPNCTEDGYTTHTCSVCGDKYTDTPVEKLGHTSGSTVTENVVAPGCEDPGSHDEVIYCTVCNIQLSRVSKVDAATGHTPGEPKNENIKDATCTTEGSYDIVVRCVNKGCNEILSTEHKSGVLLPHNYEEVIIDADHLKTDKNCSAYAVYYYDCTECTANAANENGPTFEYVEGGKNADVHATEEVTLKDVIDVTCYRDGFTGNYRYNCCDAIKIAGTVVSKSTVDHTAGTPVTENNKLPTCTVDGSYDTVTYCSVCEDNGYTTEINRVTTVVDATGHSYSSVVTSPTCTEGGFTTYTCSVCNDTYTDDVTEKLGHTFNNYVSNNDATCTEDGTKTSKCVRCDETDTVADEGSATGHSYSAVVTSPTCTEGGFTTYTCSVCNDTYTDDVTEKLGHTFNNYVSNNDATCTEDGTKTSKCVRCDETDTVADEGSAKGHTPGDTVFENEVNISCTTNGSHDEVVYCTVCNEEISRKNVSVTAPGHTPSDPVRENEIPATETVDGSYESVVYCSVCDAEISRTTVVTKVERTITFVLKGGNVTVKAYNGDMVELPDVPDYTAENGFVYKFKGWNKPVAIVNGDATYFALYFEPADWSQLDNLKETLEDVLSGGYVEDSVLEANKEEIDKVLAQIDTILAERNTLDETQQSRVDFVAGNVNSLIDTICPDAGSELVITGSSVQYVGSVLDIKAIKMPIGTEVTDAVWTSSDEDVIFVAGGKLYSVGIGTVTITVTRGVLKAQKTISVVEGGNIRGITFTSVNNTHFIIEDYYAVYNSARLFWSDDCDLRFRLRVYQSAMFDEYMVYVNGNVVQPDADGYYVIPAGSGDARVTVAGVMIDTEEGDGSGEVVTKWSFWEWLLNFFRKIAAFFQGMFK